MLVTVGGALKSEAHIYPPQLDMEARGEAVTLVVQRTGTLPQPGNWCHAPQCQISSKALSDPSRKQWMSKQPTMYLRGEAVAGGGWWRTESMYKTCMTHRGDQRPQSQLEVTRVTGRE